MNELDPGQGGPATPAAETANPLEAQPAAGDPHAEMLSHFNGMQDQAAARFQTMKEAVKRLDMVRKELDHLVSLGDTVDTEALVKAAGKLVAGGFGAVQVAGLLADAPEQGEALQSWIAEQDQQVAQRETQAQRALAMTRHELGLTALRHMIGVSSGVVPTEPPAGPAAEPVPGNQLSPEEPV